MAKNVTSVSKSLQSLKDEIKTAKKSFPVLQKEVHDLHVLKDSVKELKKQDEILQSEIDELRSDVTRLPTNHDLEMVESGVTDRIIATTEKIHHQIHDVTHRLESMQKRLEVTERTMLKIFETLIAQTENWYHLGRNILEEDVQERHESDLEKQEA